MKKIFTVFLIFSCVNAVAQPFYFPKSWYADTAAFNKHLPELATQLIPFYKTADKGAYYDNLFRLELAAGHYQAAIITLDSFQALLKISDPLAAKGLGFQFRTFAETKLQQVSSHTSFSDTYPPVFIRLYDALPLTAATAADSYFTNDLAPLKINFDKLMQHSASRDSLSLPDAIALCRAAVAYTVYSQIIPLALPLLADRDSKKYIIEDSVLITTRDGAKVTAIIVRKRDTAGKLPVIFVFNIYNSARDKSIAKEAANNGYAGVVVNTRGKKLSPQEIEPFEHDASDAYDIIDWISKQPWSNGKIGMFGGSYLGFSQWAAAKKLHPALKTIMPEVAVGIGIDYPMENNVFMTYMLRWIHYVTNSKETDQAEFNNNVHWDSVFTAWYASGKTFRSLDTLEGRPNTIFQRWLMHPSFDNYWQQMVAYKNDFSNINIPVLTTTGYFDDDQLGAMYYFRQHHLYNKNANHYLLIGPYNHGGAQSIPAAVLNGYNIDAVANISIAKLAYQWFNYILKDSARPMLLENKVNYQVMGTNTWKHAASLQQMNNDTLSFYCGNTRVGPHYILETKKPLVPEFIRQLVDFKDRSDSAYSPPDNIIDSNINLSNGISFISEVFKSPIEINGSFFGELNLAINKKDADVFIAMYELMADGKYFTLSNFLTRASYSNDRLKRQLLQAGKIERIAVNNSFFTSRKIAAGSRLVVVVGINKNPSWQVNYGTGKDVSDESIKDAMVPLQVKWYNSSTIKIPVFRHK